MLSPLPYRHFDNYIAMCQAQGRTTPNAPQRRLIPPSRMLAPVTERQAIMTGFIKGLCLHQLPKNEKFLRERKVFGFPLRPKILRSSAFRAQSHPPQSLTSTTIFNGR